MHQAIKPDIFNTRKESILVIDDSTETLALQRITLGLEGFDVFTAQSGTEALSLLSKMEKPDLILLDMQLGDMSGTEFLIQLEETNPEIVESVPVVFLTGMDEVPKSKAVGFIRKPTNMGEFLCAVHGFIEMGNHAPYCH
jgi:CheY-like chemotaxis protein